MGSSSSKTTTNTGTSSTPGGPTGTIDYRAKPTMDDLGAANNGGVEISKSILDFNLGEKPCPLKFAVQDQFTIVNMNKSKLKFNIEPIQPKEFQLSFSPSVGSIDKGKSKSVKVKLIVNQKINTNHKVVLRIEGGASHFLTVKIRCETGVFGVDPMTLECVEDEGYRIPQILVLMKSSLVENGGLQQEGIFRLAGEQTEIKRLKESMNKNEFKSSNDINTIASLIKIWYRELPTPILNSIPTEKIFYSTDESECVAAVNNLPEPQKSLLDWLMNLLLEVSSYSTINKMTAQNLAIVVAPNLYDVSSSNPMEGLESVEKIEWMPDKMAIQCNSCNSPFTLIRRRHHCRKCGSIFCDPCSSYYTILPQELGYSGQQRLCKSCHHTFDQKQKYFEGDGLIAQFQLRSSNFEFSKLLLDIGNIKHGLRKTYILVKSDDGNECLMSVITPGQSCLWSMSNEKLKKTFIETLNAIKHSSILPILHTEISGSNDKVLMFRQISKTGSLRDVIYKSKPFSPFDAKYQIKTKKQNQSGVQSKLIGKYSKQILEGLVYLRSRGLIFQHLHPSNVIIVDGDNCQLTDIENNLLGLKPLYYEYISMKENPDVLCFGHLLFEMIVGIPLGDPQNIHNFIPLYPEKIYDILKQIFNSTLDNNQSTTTTTTPTPEELLKNSYFENISIITTSSKSKQQQHQSPDSSTVQKLKKSQSTFIKEYSGKIESPPATKSLTSTSYTMSSTSNSNLNMLKPSTSSNSLSSSSSNAYTPNTQLAYPQPPIFKKQVSSTSILDSKQPSPVVQPSTTNTTNNSTKTNTTSPPPPPQVPITKTTGPVSSTLPTPPPPPPPKAPSAPPPPPPPSSTPPISLPPQQPGKSQLLDSIRNPDNFKRLKKVTPNQSKKK
eukprot:gene1274-1605_t